MDPLRTVAAVDRTVFKSRRVAVGLGAVSVLCGAAAIIMNFGILDRTQREPVGNFVQTISDRGSSQIVNAPSTSASPTRPGLGGSTTTTATTSATSTTVSEAAGTTPPTAIPRSGDDANDS